MEIEKSVKEKVEKFLSLSDKNMGDALGIEFLSFKRDEVVASMPVNENTVQPFGILHGGASVSLAETVASLGAWLNVDDSKTAVGVEINANHLKSVPKGGRVTATATPVHRGRKVHTWQIHIHNEEGKLVCTSRCTLMIVDRG